MYLPRRIFASCQKMATCKWNRVMKAPQITPHVFVRQSGYIYSLLSWIRAIARECFCHASKNCGSAFLTKGILTGSTHTSSAASSAAADPGREIPRRLHQHDIFIGMDDPTSPLYGASQASSPRSAKQRHDGNRSHRPCRGLGAGRHARDGARDSRRQWRPRRSTIHTNPEPSPCP